MNSLEYMLKPTHTSRQRKWATSVSQWKSACKHHSPPLIAADARSAINVRLAFQHMFKDSPVLCRLFAAISGKSYLFKQVMANPVHLFSNFILPLHAIAFFKQLSLLSYLCSSACTVLCQQLPTMKNPLRALSRKLKDAPQPLFLLRYPTAPISMLYVSAFFSSSTIVQTPTPHNHKPVRRLFLVRYRDCFVHEHYGKT